jgi:hypothetical protein
MLKPDGNIVFSFTPWAVQELDELWEEFGNVLLDALEGEELEVEFPGKGTIRKLQEKLRSTGIKKRATMPTSRRSLMRLEGSTKSKLNG